MVRYYFDIHADSLSVWDHDGTEYGSQEDAIIHAGMLLQQAIRDRVDPKHAQHAVASVRDIEGNTIFTATLGMRSDLRITWAPSKSTDGADAHKNPPPA